MKSSTFKVSTIAGAVLLCFASSAALATVTTSSVEITVNNEKVTVAKDATELGKDGDVVKFTATRPGYHLLKLEKSGTLTISGKTVESVGGRTAFQTLKGTKLVVGSAKTDTIDLKAESSILDIRSTSEAVFDAKTIFLSTIDDVRSTALPQVGAEVAWGGTLTIGKHAESITMNVFGNERASNHYAQTLLVTGGTANIGNVNATVKLSATHNLNASGIYAKPNSSEKDASVSLVGNTISVVANSKKKAQGILTVAPTGKKSQVSLLGKDIAVEANASSEAYGVISSLDSKVTLGDATTNSVTIKSVNTEIGDSSSSIGLWAENTGNSGQDGGQIAVMGKKISITAEGTNDTRAIFVASNDLNPKSRASVKLIGDEINIISKSTNNDNRSKGIVAMSAGDVEVVGNTMIMADDAILVRGDSKVAVNSDGKHSTVIHGDIVFDYDKPTSNTPVDATVNVVLNGANSSWTGNTIVSWNGDHTDSDTKLDVTGMSLTLSNNAIWTPTVTANDPTTQDQGSKYVALNHLKLDNGIVAVTDEKVAVTVENLSGKGVVNVATDGNTSGTFQVADASKDSSLEVNLMNQAMTEKLTSDQLSEESAKKLLGNIGGEKVASTTVVPEGMILPGYGIDAQGQSHQAQANTLMQSSLELAAAAPLALNRIMMNDVRKRLGDIRTTEGTHGVWARYDGGKLTGEGSLKNDFNTIQVGMDTVPMEGSARMGVAFSYTDSDAEYARGNADMKAYSIAMYGTKMFENGMFFDVIGRMGTADTDLTVDGKHKGTMDNVVLGVSGEVGWRFDVNDMFYVEPQAEMTYTYVNGENLKLSTASYEVDSVNSLMGRLGFAAGLKCPADKGNVYVRASAVHEFLGDSKITGTNLGQTDSYKIDGQDTWVEYGIGANFNMTKSTYVWADIERTTGGALDEDWRATVGVRYAF